VIRKYQPQDLEHIMKIWLETNLAAHGFIPAEYWNEQYEAVKVGSAAGRHSDL